MDTDIVTKYLLPIFSLRKQETAEPTDKESRLALLCMVIKP